MGNTSITCQRDTQAKSDLISRELHIYQWRAESEGKFIPKVSFRKQTQIKREERLNDFIDRYKQRDYFQLNKLREEVEGVRENNQQILLFQKYACSFDQLNCVLEMEEVVYVLQALLTAYEEIKKKYQIITINKSCCFVTFNGQVRAWINSNPKSNQLETSNSYQYLNERDYNQTIFSIVKMVKETAIKTQKALSFFQELQKQVNSVALRADLFGHIRSWIVRYCKKQYIGVSINIYNALKRQIGKKIKNITRRPSINSQKMETDTQVVDSSTIQHPAFITPIQAPIQEVPDQSPPIHKTFGVNIKTIDSTYASFALPHNSNLPTPNNSRHHIQGRGFSFSFKHSDSIQGPSTDRSQQKNKDVYKGSQVMEKTEKPIKTIRQQQTKDTLKVRFVDGHNQNLFSNCQTQTVSEDGTLLEGNFLTSKQLTNVLTLSKTSRRPHKHRRSSGEASKGVVRNVSILDICEEQQTIRKQNKKPSIHFQTFQQINSSMSITDPGRPYITSKTIKRLFPDSKQDLDSLIHSEGTSQQYSGTVYSGALTSMGRQVPMHRRSNTGCIGNVVR